LAFDACVQVDLHAGVKGQSASDKKECLQPEARIVRHPAAECPSYAVANSQVYGQITRFRSLPAT